MHREAKRSGMVHPYRQLDETSASSQGMSHVSSSLTRNRFTTCFPIPLKLTDLIFDVFKVDTLHKGHVTQQSSHYLISTTKGTAFQYTDKKTKKTFDPSGRSIFKRKRKCFVLFFFPRSMGVVLSVLNCNANDLCHQVILNTYEQ